MRKIYFLLVLLLTNLTYAQQLQELNKVYGRLLSDSINVYKAGIVNKNSKTETQASQDGSFNIYAKVNDTIYIHHRNITTMQYVIEPEDFKIDLKIKVYPVAVDLDEIMIYKSSNSGVLSRYEDENLKRINESIRNNTKLFVGYDINEEHQNSRKLLTALDNNMSGNIKSNYTNTDFVGLGKSLYKSLTKKKVKQSESDKVKTRLISLLTIEVLTEQLQMSKSEFNYYTNFLVSYSLIDMKKIESTSSLDILADLIKKKDVYHDYLLSEIE